MAPSPEASSPRPDRRAQPVRVPRVPARAGRAACASRTSRCCPARPFPLGATWNGTGTNFSLFSESAAARRTVPVRRRRPRDPRSDPRGNRVHPSRVPARRRAGSALRLPRARAVVAAAGRAQQPAEVAARSVRQGGHRCGRLGSARLSVSLRRREPSEHERQRALHAEVGRRQPVLRLGQRPAAGHAVARDARVRGARQGLHADAPVGAAEPPRHVRGARGPRRRRLVRRARCHRGRADAGAPVRARPPARADGPAQLLGLQLDRLLRAARRVQRHRRSRPAGAGVQADGAHVARRRASK